MRMLVIDDQMTTRMLLRCMLETYGEVVEAKAGAEGVEMFGAALTAGAPFQMVCVDLGLPDIDGNQVLEQLRAAEVQHRASAPATIVVVSGNDTDEARSDALERSADAYLTKPVSYESMFALLARVGAVGRAVPGRP
ncbi:MAG: response regulator [Planctomycetota bacterium]